MFIAIAPKGQEYIYKRITRLSVPKASAQMIADVLTENRYKLRDGEVWHVYETEFGEDEMSGRARLYKGKIRVNWEVVYP